MQRDYKELLEEIKEITTADGFVSSCLEIKESLFFYELELVLAAYTASLELLAVAALLNAALKAGATCSEPGLKWSAVWTLSWRI